MRTRNRITPIPLILLALILMLTTGLPVAAAPAVESVLTFDPVLREFPQGIVFDAAGNLYVSIEPWGEVWRYAPGSTTPTVVAQLTNLSALGLAVGPDGAVYVAAAPMLFAAPPDDACGICPNVPGVYRITSDPSAPTLVPGTDAISYPKNLTFDPQGNLYITDLFPPFFVTYLDGQAGRIWRVPPGGSAEVWTESDLLKGTGAFYQGLLAGPNGIAYRANSLYVSVTDTGRIVRIPVNGSRAGEPELFYDYLATAPGGALDGLVLNARGDIYVSAILQNTVILIDRHGSGHSIVAGPKGLSSPASLAFGPTPQDQHNLYIANFAFYAAMFGGVPEPGIVRITVRAPGGPGR